MESDAFTFGTIFMVAAIVAGALAILWTILPLVVFQIHRSLRELLTEVKHLNRSIATIRKEIRPDSPHGDEQTGFDTAEIEGYQ